MKAIFTMLMLLCGFPVFAQLAPHKYFIEFRDKNQNPYSLNHPEEFLTQRAIQRRQAMGIGYVENDLPVTPSYIQGLQNVGAQILNPTKWLNGTTIYLADTNLIQTIRNLPFVKSVVKNSVVHSKKWEQVDKFHLEEQVVAENQHSMTSTKSALAYDYGESFKQIHMVNGDLMHQNGFRGQGIVIAQLDAGFYNVPFLPAFDSLWANNQILGNKDFVRNGLPLFGDPDDKHGMWVLSIMGGILPGHLIGSAPKASFWLLKTEEVQHEYETEEYNWVSGAEFADSVGADVITSSLGYTVFDSTFKDHTCADMNGHTTICSRGANIAFSKGIVVIVSAGNEGENPSWHCVSAPADADYAIACAAVDSNGIRVAFSSLGVDTSGRVKPNVAAMGAKTVIQDVGGTFGRGSGTSFSAPIIAGMTACLIQSKPGFANSLIKRAIELSGSHSLSPDSLTGFGIPDFFKAMNTMNIYELKSSNSLSIFPNPSRSEFTLRFNSDKTGTVKIKVVDLLGKIILLREVMAREGENVLSFSNSAELHSGMYLVILDAGFLHASQRLIRMPD